MIQLRKLKLEKNNNKQEIPEFKDEFFSGLWP